MGEFSCFDFFVDYRAGAKSNTFAQQLHFAQLGTLISLISIEEKAAQSQRYLRSFL